MEKEWDLARDILMETVEHLKDVTPQSIRKAKINIMTCILKIEQHLKTVH